MISIYKITNLINNKIYIGQTKNFKKRMNDHKNRNKKNKSLVCSAIIKHGENNFKFEEIAIVPLIFANVFERECIKLYNSLVPSGYNIEEGGGCQYSLSQIARDKISKKLTGRKRPVFSKETREKMSKWQRGRKRPPFSEETKKRMGDAHRGKKLTKDHVLKMSESQKGRIKGAMKKETRIKISKSNKGQKRSCDFVLNQRKRGPSKNSKTGYKGVSEYGKRFISRVKINRKEIILGIFETSQEAAIIYDKKMIELYGFEVYLNFRDQFIKDS
jgi:group I intron endonuclease